MLAKFLLGSMYFFLLPSLFGQVQKFQKDAQSALLSQQAKEGKDCLDAGTTYGENICIGKVEALTKQDFDRFYNSLVSLLAPEASNIKKLEDAQAAWVQYRAKSCDAIGHLYEGGTIRPSAVAGCEIALMRSRMRDLDNIYYTVLHN